MIVAFISPNEAIRARLQMALRADEGFDAVWSLAAYPGLQTLEPLIDQRQGCVVALDFGTANVAGRLAETLGDHRHIRVVAVNATAEKGGLTSAAKAGVRDILGSSFSVEELSAAIHRAAQQLRVETTLDPGGEIHAFLPAKAGSGATTVALNTASLIPALTASSVVLLDFDLKMGLTSFLLRLDAEHSVADALEQARRMDDPLWQRLVSERGDLHVLGSAPMTFSNPPSVESFDLLLRFAQQRYANVIVDLPGTMNDHEVLTLGRARHILLVCYPDIAGLHVARRKLEQLQELEVDSKVCIVLNQTGGRGMLGTNDVEKVLNRPVTYSLPEDCRSVTDAVRQGAPIRSGSDLGRKLQGIAKDLAKRDFAGPTPRKLKSFIEFFSVAGPRSLRAR